ncbi:MAG: hypothetical protein JRI23_14995 [Deltaproteobacteria bacterium]|nr:hypothetical protein [Deltaproteobacteria bacterium]MBW2533057.1 hypothetical protein [Deltaproteobacteria bacterium]
MSRSRSGATTRQDATCTWLPCLNGGAIRSSRETCEDYYNLMRVKVTVHTPQ